MNDVTDPTPAPAQQGALSEDEIAEIRRCAEAATGGLWVVVHDATERSISTTESGRFVCHLNSNMLRYTDDADFIAHARTDVPRLLATLDALREQHAHLLAQHEGDAQILGDHIAALGDWQRASERDGLAIAELKAEMALLKADLEGAYSAENDVRVLLSLADEGYKRAKQRLAEARTERDEWRTIAGNRLEALLISRRAHAMTSDEKLQAEQALADERATTARLRDQISTARAQLDAWQQNRPGATVQATAATLAASPGPESREDEHVPVNADDYTGNVFCGGCGDEWPCASVGAGQGAGEQGGEVQPHKNDDWEGGL